MISGKTTYKIEVEFEGVAYRWLCEKELGLEGCQVFFMGMFDSFIVVSGIYSF